MSTIETDWTFLSSYAHVLICLAENPNARLREVAERIGVTERTATRLIARLDEAGIVQRTRHGRRNCYRIIAGEPLCHPIEARCTLDQLLRTALGADNAQVFTSETGDG
jgi:Mn-dependent DtxR family transcriptional regulator